MVMAQPRPLFDGSGKTAVRILVTRGSPTRAAADWDEVDPAGRDVHVAVTMAAEPSALYEAVTSFDIHRP